MADEEKKTLHKKQEDHFTQVAKVRQPHEEVWREVIEMMRPELSLWYDTEGEAKGKKRNLMVYNGSPAASLQISADGMQGLLASASLDWFKYGLPDSELADIPEVT